MRMATVQLAISDRVYFPNREPDKRRFGVVINERECIFLKKGEEGFLMEVEAHPKIEIHSTVPRPPDDTKPLMLDMGPGGLNTGEVPGEILFALNAITLTLRHVGSKK